jgi:uncharacterized protein
MAEPVTLFVAALACAAVIGFAAHRASLCNVRAVAEIMTSGSAHMLGSLLQAALWMALMAGILTLVAGWSPRPVLMPAQATWAVAGGGIFGVGAALNGGCSLSTLHRLADGELGMLATLLSFALGVLAWSSAGGGAAHAASLQAVVPLWTRWPTLAPWLLAVLVLWALQRVRTFRQLAAAATDTSPAATLTERVFAPAYPLAVSAALMGLAGGALYALQGAWSYTNHLRASVLQAWSGGPAPAATHTALVGALIAGMLLSAIQRGSWRLSVPPAVGSWLRHIGGGVLMGAGAAMVPGGNDTLLLNALPTLAAQAIAAYIAMLAGITLVLWLMRYARWPMPTVLCTPDGCHEAAAPLHHTSSQGDPG